MIYENLKRLCIIMILQRFICRNGAKYSDIINIDKTC